MQSSSNLVPRNWRVRFALIRTFLWDLPDGRCFTLPVAVSRNRFFVALWVLNFTLAMIVFFFQQKLSRDCRANRRKVKVELSILWPNQSKKRPFEGISCVDLLRLDFGETQLGSDSSYCNCGASEFCWIYSLSTLTIKAI